MPEISGGGWNHPSDAINLSEKTDAIKTVNPALLDLDFFVQGNVENTIGPVSSTVEYRSA